MTKRITEEEVEKLYDVYQTPPHVISHCKAVAKVAVRLASELNRHGYQLDLDLIKGAGLSHDVARTEEEHWLIGCKALEKLGYHDEAEIVRVHMFYSFLHAVNALDETDLVCLGDRLVKEDRYVGLDERIAYILDKAPKDPEVRKRILEKKEETRKLLDKIENVIGTKIDQLFAGE